MLEKNSYSVLKHFFPYFQKFDLFFRQGKKKAYLEKNVLKLEIHVTTFVKGVYL